MTTPDILVSTLGVSVTLERVSAAVFNDYDDFDEDASTIVTESVNAVKSQPRERDLRNFQGRDNVPSLRLTVESSTDIDAMREGRADRVTVDGIVYEVLEVQDSTHFIAGIRKKTVLLGALPGRT